MSDVQSVSSRPDESERGSLLPAAEATAAAGGKPLPESASGPSGMGTGSTRPRSESSGSKPHIRPLPASKRMRLSPQGEIRALLRLGASDELAPQIREVVMATEVLDEVIEPTVILHFTENHITLDQRTAQALYGLAWERFEEALVRANVAYNQTEWSSPHERAKELLWAADALKEAIAVVYELTPMPEDEIEE